MENFELYSSFAFKNYHRTSGKHTDSSAGCAYHYIGYLYRGSARIISEKDTLELQAGDLFYIPKGCRYHSYWYDGANFDSFAFSAIPQKEHISYCLQKLDMTQEVKILHKELAADRTVSPGSVATLYKLLWVLMPTMRQHTYDKGGVLARTISNAIYEQPDVSTEAIAKKCGVSQSTVYHLLKKELGKTPNRLRQEAKCQQAVRLLTCTDLSVEEISVRLGFSSSSYMRKLLHSTTGKTPLQLRKAAQSM